MYLRDMANAAIKSSTQLHAPHHLVDDCRLEQGDMALGCKEWVPGYEQACTHPDAMAH